MKEQFRERHLGQKISHVHFGLFSETDIQRISNVRVASKDLYDLPARTPSLHGPLDRRMGAFDKIHKCETCGNELKDCEGHYGHIELELPVFHIGFFKSIYGILQKICKSCSRVLLSETDIRNFSRKFRDPNVEKVTRQNLAKEVAELCKRNSTCPHCREFNGQVKKVGVMKLIHEKYSTKNGEVQASFLDSFDSASDVLKDLPSFLATGRAQDDLHPLRALTLFKAIPDSDCIVLGMDPTRGRPESLIIQSLIVPPGCIRPSVAMDAGSAGGGGSNEDPLSTSLAEILLFNETIAKNLTDPGRTEGKGGQKLEKIMESWDLLQIHCALYFNGDLTGLPQSQQPKKPSRGFYQRLKGKQGRFRGNLSGKRVNFSGRTVISPDPNLGIDEVAVPMHVCKILTFPEMANDYNIEHLRTLIRNGPDVHPGADSIVNGSNGLKKNLRYGNRELTARNLRVGDIVHRHIVDGDAVLFNRQPSLHKLSIMCHKVKVRPWRTFRFNECVCKPYNADFDGDEMNLHVPQTVEAAAEAATLMSTVANICTPCNGTPLISATQDFITGAYLLTQKDLFFTRDRICQMATFLGDGNLLIDLPPPCIIKPICMWSGKQVMSILLQPCKKTNINVNLETENKNFDNKWAKEERKRLGRDLTPGELSLCPEDGFIIIRNSQLLSGFFDKGIIGESKSTIFYILLQDYGEQHAAVAMKRLAKVTSRFMQENGFSIGIEDVTPTDELTEAKNKMVKEGYDTCYKHINQYYMGKMQASPGCSPEQSLEALMRGILSDIRDKAGQHLRDTLPISNAPRIMARCGSKGSNLNMSQMIACVGQQIINGERIPNGFDSRPLPHFRRDDKTPPAKGFVKNSFYTGLTPTEFFFHTMSGREGLVDTAVKTAETGYMQRRLMKALEDLTVQYDLTVRNSTGSMIQFCYGEDGLDPTRIEENGTAIGLDHLLSHITASEPHKGEPGLLPFQLCEEAEAMFPTALFETFRPPYSPVGLNLDRPGSEHFFIGVLRKFIRGVAEKLGKKRRLHDLEPCLFRSDDHESDRNLSDENEMLVDKILRVSRSQLQSFIKAAVGKYHNTVIEAGTAVGALGAQSIGEPGTQMTLKTFHFAGVASMNVTMGVPRIKEIINASKQISTPIIEAILEDAYSPDAARRVKGRIETTLLGQITRYFEVVYEQDKCYVNVGLDLDRMQRLMLELDTEGVAVALTEAKKLKLKKDDVVKVGKSKIRVYVPRTEKRDFFYSLERLRTALPNVPVVGIKDVKRAIVSEKNGEHSLFIDGMNMRAVMATRGVIGTKVKSNNVIEIDRCLGIEAARMSIMKEVQDVMGNYGIKIDPRHTMLMGDLMTFKGEVLGITRFGIAKMKESVFMLASFEKTTDHLFDAALSGTMDSVTGVSECIILGVPMSIGTGLFKLLHRPEKAAPPSRRTVLFDQPEFHRAMTAPTKLKSGGGL